jgi:hypothetical protein
MTDPVPRAGETGDLEQLAEELSLRDLRVTLAPDSGNELVLEVINSRPDFMGAAVRAGRVYWHDGAFWWSCLAEPERLPDVARAVERITTSLQWARQYPALQPADPGA